MRGEDVHRGDAEEPQRSRRGGVVTNDGEVTGRIIGAAIAVHRAIGPGLLESAYQECLSRELAVRGIPFARQIPLRVDYRGVVIDCAYRLDLLVASCVVVEIKSLAAIEPVHEAQLLTYMPSRPLALALLINFNVPLLKKGIRRFIDSPI